MATNSIIGVEPPKNLFWDEILATYFFSVDKWPAKIWAKTVTYSSPKWKSYMESAKEEVRISARIIDHRAMIRGQNTVVIALSPTTDKQ